MRPADATAAQRAPMRFGVESFSLWPAATKKFFQDSKKRAQLPDAYLGWMPSLLVALRSGLIESLVLTGAFV